MCFEWRSRYHFQCELLSWLCMKEAVSVSRYRRVSRRGTVTTRPQPQPSFFIMCTCSRWLPPSCPALLTGWALLILQVLHLHCSLGHVVVANGKLSTEVRGMYEPCLLVYSLYLGACTDCLHNHTHSTRLVTERLHCSHAAIERTTCHTACTSIN